MRMEAGPEERREEQPAGQPAKLATELLEKLRTRFLERVTQTSVTPMQSRFQAVAAW